MELHSARNQYLAAVVSSLGSLGYGLLLGWPCPILPLLLSKETPLEAPLTLEDSSWVVSLEYIGNFTGTLFFGYVIDLIGRKRTICLSVIPFLIASLLVAFGRTGAHINISRFIMGVGGGGCLVSFPVYIAEISDIKIRGRLLTIFPVTTNIGITLGIVLGSFLSYYLFAYLLVAITVLVLVVKLFLPETPMFLQHKGKMKEAEKSNLWFHGKPCAEDQMELETLTKNCKQLTVSKQSSLHKYKQLLTKVTLKGLFIGMMIFVFQQTTGYFPLVYYSSVIFEETGSTFMSPNLSIIVAEICKNIGLIVANLLIEKIGRKILLLLSSLGVVVSLIFLGLYLYLQILNVDLSSYNWIPLLIISSYNFLYSIGFGVVPYVIVTELFSAEIKATGVSICVISYEITSFIISKNFSLLVVAFGWHGCFWFFAVLTFVGTIFLWIFVPETKNRTTESILRDLLD